MWLGATDLRRLLRSNGMGIVPVGGVAGRVSADQFSAFYAAAFRDVHRYLLRAVLGDHALAEDLTQDTFAVAVVAARAGRAEALSLAWVLGVARHKVIDHYRKASRDERRMSLLAARGDDVDYLQALADQEPARIVRVLAELSSEHRLVLVLKYLDDLTVEQIAAELDKSSQAIESLLARARRALARDVQEAAS
jgi:RNA polymerase sigma-70 factor (ECF subfamily)